MSKQVKSNNKLDWEVEEIDLNIRHYLGHHLQVFKSIKKDIENYLSNPDVPLEKRQIYSSIYNALNYYIAISNLPSENSNGENNFVENCIASFNEDYDYLSKKYNLGNTETITFLGRVKSPISFMGKVKNKVTEYLKNGKDLAYLNESITDLIGIRIIVDPPEDVKSNGLQAESDYLYKVFYDLASFRNIFPSENKSSTSPYRFIPVNTISYPRKLENIKNRVKKEGFAEEIAAGKVSIHIPTSRPAEFDEEPLKSIIKDYNLHPKHSGYQALHTCISPIYSDNILTTDTPSYIIPPKNNYITFEYQVRTKKQDDYAEHGFASHGSSYKKRESFHRLGIPYYISSDFQCNRNSKTELDTNNSSTQNNNSRTLKIRPFEESFEKYYGYTFESYFGISYKDFIEKLTPIEQESLLNREKQLVPAEEISTSKKLTQTLPSSIVLTEDELKNLKKILENDDMEALSEFFDNHNLIDSNSNSFDPQKQKKLAIVIYILKNKEKNIDKESKKHYENKNENKKFKKPTNPKSLD